VTVTVVGWIGTRVVPGVVPITVWSVLRIDHSGIDKPTENFNKVSKSNARLAATSGAPSGFSEETKSPHQGTGEGLWHPFLTIKLPPSDLLPGLWPWTSVPQIPEWPPTDMFSVYSPPSLELGVLLDNHYTHLSNVIWWHGNFIPRLTVVAGYKTCCKSNPVCKHLSTHTRDNSQDPFVQTNVLTRSHQHLGS